MPERKQVIGGRVVNVGASTALMETKAVRTVAVTSGVHPVRCARLLLVATPIRIRPQTVSRHPQMGL
jgi:hypothetical protein